MADPKQTRTKASSMKAKEKSTPSKKTAASPGKGTKKGLESMSFLLIVALVLIAANVAGYFFFARADLTENRLYSLSQGSKNLVSNLEDNMVITAYFTSDLPPPFNATERYVRNLLAEYEAASSGKIRVRFIDPDDDEEKEEATEAGVREVQHQVIENDSVSVRTGFRGIVISYLGEREVIPVIQDTQGIEYAITQRLRQMVREPLAIGIASGHGSPTPTKGLSTLQQAIPQYELREVNVSEEISDDLHALLIVDPTEELSDTELRRINQYVMKGRSLGVFGGAMNVQLQGMPGPTAQPSNTGINTLLGPWGIELRPGIVADARCGRVPLSRQFPIPVPYPPAPIVVFDEEQQEHPALFRINQAPFFFTSAIRTRDAFQRLHGKVLARSSGEDLSWLMTGDNLELQPRDPREWSPTGNVGPHTVMVALDARLPSAFTGPAPASEGGAPAPQIEAPAQSARAVRVLVAGTGALFRDEFLPPPEQQEQGQMSGGLALALNAIDWLAQDADLIAIRAKNIEDPALDVPQHVQEAEQEVRTAAEQGDEEETEDALARHREAIKEWDSKKAWYRYGITIGLPLLIALAGLGRWYLRANKRSNLDQLRARLVRERNRGREPKSEKRTRRNKD